MGHDFQIGNIFSAAFEDHIIAICSSESRCYIDQWSKLLLIRKGLQKVQGCPHLSRWSRILCTRASDLHHLTNSSLCTPCLIYIRFDVESYSPRNHWGFWCGENMWNNSHGPFLASEQGPGGQYPQCTLALMRSDQWTYRELSIPERSRSWGWPCQQETYQHHSSCQKKHILQDYWI